MGQDQFSQQDPTRQHAQPGSGRETVKYPGRTEEMDVQPDHGEQTYRGIGRLEGKKAVITGGDSGIGRADVVLDRVRAGDVLVFSHAGAYGWEISHHDFLSHLHPEHVFLGAGTAPCRPRPPVDAFSA